MTIINLLKKIIKPVASNQSKNVKKHLEMFKLAVENASDQIVITDSDGIIVYANKAIKKLTGYQVSEVIGKKAGSIELWGGLMDSDFYDKLWQTIKQEKCVFSGEIKNKRKNDEEYIAISSISPVLNDQQQVIYFVAIERDITKEKEIDQAKSEFVSLASHQLRTPLTAIGWYAEMLISEDIGKLNDKQRKYLKEIHKSNKRMTELVGSLLNVSRLETGAFLVNPEEVKVRDICNSVVGELQTQILTKKITVEKQYDKIVPESIMLDKKLFRIVVQNLMSNAVKYTNQGGRIKISLKNKKKQLEICVSDTGIGIPVAQQHNIFQKLFRAENVKTLDTDGTGLGLYIVREIANHCGGKIWFDSEENKGSNFYFTIPITGMKYQPGKRIL